MTGWDATSFSVGLSVGGAAMLAFLLMLFWAQERAEQASQTPQTPPSLDAKRRELLTKLNERKGTE